MDASELTFVRQYNSLVGCCPSSDSNGPTGPAGPTGPVGPASPYGVITGLLKIPISGGAFVPGATTSTFPVSFGTFNSGSSTSTKFVIDLNTSRYTTTNVPIIQGTCYFYNGIQWTYMDRFFGGLNNAAVQPYIDSTVQTLTFDNVTTSVFPSAANDPSGYAVYIFLSVFN